MKLLPRILYLLACLCLVSSFLPAMARRSSGGGTEKPCAAGAVFYAMSKQGKCKILLGEERGAFSSFGGYERGERDPFQIALLASDRETLSIFSEGDGRDFTERFHNAPRVEDEGYSVFFVDVSDLVYRAKAGPQAIECSFARLRKIVVAAAASSSEAASSPRVAKDRILFIEVDKYLKLLCGDLTAVEKELDIRFDDHFLALSLRNRETIKEFFREVMAARGHCRCPRAKR